MALDLGFFAYIDIWWIMKSRMVLITFFGLWIFDHNLVQYRVQDWVGRAQLIIMLSLVVNAPCDLINLFIIK